MIAAIHTESLTRVSIYNYYIGVAKSTLKQRLENIFSDLSVNQIDFSRRIGFGQSYISQIISGSKTSPSPRFYDAVCREFNINSEWLKTRKGDRYIIPGVTAESQDAEILAKYRLLPFAQQRIIDDMINALLVKSK